MPSPETGSIRPAASPTSSARSAAIRVPGRRSGSRCPRRLLELVRVEPVRLAGAAQVLAELRALALPRRRRRRSRGRPSGTPTRSRPGCRPARARAGARSARAAASGSGRFPRTRRRRRCRSPSPTACARDPVRAVGADDHVGRDPLARRPNDTVLSGSIATFTPSRTSTPRSRAASSRNASSRRRCVIQTTGSFVRCTTASP